MNIFKYFTDKELLWVRPAHLNKKRHANRFDGYANTGWCYDELKLDYFLSSYSVYYATLKRQNHKTIADII